MKMEIHIFKDNQTEAETVIYPDENGFFTIDDNFDLNATFQIKKGEK